MDYETKERLKALRENMKSYGYIDGVEELDSIFPELRESEDESIRKELIEFIKWSVDRHFMREDFHQAKRPPEWIAYLEKQKEQSLRDFIDDFSYSDEQKEQKYYWKPTETDVALFNKAVTTNKTLTPTERAQLDIIRSKFGYCRAVNCSGIVQKEQKPTWSEEDEKMRSRILDIFACDQKHYLDEIAWLKSLRPGWKPTDKQMKALQSAKFIYKDGLDNSAVASIIESLYNDLLELK